MFIKRNILRFLLLALSCSCLVNESRGGYCSLDKMKKYAMEACEHLFLEDDEIRERRSLSPEHNLIESSGYTKSYDKKHFISRSIYPSGGYLKVGHKHFRVLSQVDVIPKYKPKRLHHEKKDRFKREHSDHSSDSGDSGSGTYKNIPYCCFNRCEEDFFC